MAHQPTHVGLIGCGAISKTYLENAKKFDRFEIVAVADSRLQGAQARATEFGIPKACSVEEMLATPDIEIVVNLTPHSTHGQLGVAAVEAGKSVYNEKPLCVRREDGQRMLAVAGQKGLRVGAAPDTFFGGAWQTARKLIDAGVIGEPLSCSACLMAYWAPQREKPGPDASGYLSFYRTNFFEFGGTWSFDRGPYYLTALINLLGPVKRVSGIAANPWAKRGLADVVTTPTHFTGLLEFANGVVGTLLLSSDVYDTGSPHIEVFGTKGSLRCIDPNCFGGPLFLRKPDKQELIQVECEFGYNGNGRGVAIADMAAGWKNGRPHRASGEMAFHVIDIVNALHESSAAGRHIELKSTCERPAPLPQGLQDWTIDD